MGYMAQKTYETPPSDELRSKIAGWGVDLDPKDRPAVPKENYRPDQTGAHWTFPERQVEKEPRERSPEHKFLTPVFGTSCPPKGLSGVIRRYAYTLSEGRLSHWLLLVGADRVDVVESRIGSLLRGRPDDIIAESGVTSEAKRHGIRSRVGRGRADVKHQPLDALGFGVAALVWTPVYAIGRLLAACR
jgi:hypothetical protein